VMQKETMHMIVSTGLTFVRSCQKCHLHPG
jgi:hypothetical protein